MITATVVVSVSLPFPGTSCFAHCPSRKMLQPMSCRHAMLAPSRSGFPFAQTSEVLSEGVRDNFYDDYRICVCLIRDNSKGSGSVRVILARPTGPGGPSLDLQMVESPTSLRSPSARIGSIGRIGGVVLSSANRAAFTPTARVHVGSGIVDGGHSRVTIRTRRIPTRPSFSTGFKAR